MVKYSDGSQSGSNQSTKVNLLKKVLGILTTALHEDHERRKVEFNGMPFHRILIIMFTELTTPDPVLDPISWDIMESFGCVFICVHSDFASLIDVFLARRSLSCSLGEFPVLLSIGLTSSETGISLVVYWRRARLL